MEVACPFCANADVVKPGKTSNGKQRYGYRNVGYDHSTSVLDYSYLGYLPDIKDRILGMAAHTSGIRDTALVLDIATGTVLSTLSLLESDLESANRKVLEKSDCHYSNILIIQVENAEIDEM